MSFERFAKNYQNEAIVQKEVAKYLVTKIQKATTILDLGSGSGTLFDLMPYKPSKFYALDMSSNMLKLHPKTDDVVLINDSFDNQNFWAQFQNVDLIISCGALQWSIDIEKLIENISQKSQKVALAIFTDKTLVSLRQTTSQKTFLPTFENLNTMCNKYFKNIKCEKLNYRLYFNDKSKMFKHLKLTGVHFGDRLDYKTAKKLYNEYPLTYLEFELFVCY